MDTANIVISYLTGLSAERRASIRVVHRALSVRRRTAAWGGSRHVHHPAASGRPNVSFLKHCKKYQLAPRHLSLAEIYEDPFYFPYLIHEHQTKMFSITPDDTPDSYADVIDVDDRRLEIAKTNLEKVDVMGLSEHHGELLDGDGTAIRVASSRRRRTGG